MSLDILTEKGKVTVQQERDAIALFHRSCEDMRFVFTDKSFPSPIDGLLIRNSDSRILFAVEIKCRTCSLQTFQNEFKNQWLITDEKIAFAAGAATSLACSLQGWLYLVPDRVLMIQQLTRLVAIPGNKGFRSEYLHKDLIAKTKTQATVNGGTASRVNAFINMDDCTIIK